LDCRVDKSNRRLSFAACLLLASKVNESNSIIAYDRRCTETKSDGSKLPLMTTWVKPSKKSGKIFESLIVFFTNDWSLSLKQLYAAEWIVFTVSTAGSVVLPFLVVCKNFIRVNMFFFYPGAWVFSESQAFRRRIPLQATPKGIGMGSPELSRLRNYVRPVAG
jgi:hypothetical protein